MFFAMQSNEYLCSDLESTFSQDSLDESTKEITYNKNSFPVNCTNETVPYCTGEIPVKNIKSNVKFGVRRTLNHNKSVNKMIEEKQFDKIPKNAIQRSASLYSCNDVSLNQHTANSTRISRQREVVVINKNTIRTRHRSVSYLEQFRKRHYGNNSLDSSRYSLAGSNSSDRDKSMSVVSCLSGESRMSVSEFEFYDELLENKINEQQTWPKGSLQSSTLVAETTVKTPKPRKHLKQKKEKSVILWKVEDTIPDNQKFNLDKKKTLEKREIYAAKVKLRNQMQICRQKEKDKRDKFNNSITISNCSLEAECLLQPRQENNCPLKTNNKTNFHPLTVKQKEKPFNNQDNLPVKDVTQKTKRRGIQRNQNKKSKTISELSRLQERHEREKSLVESMRNLIINI